MAIQHDVVHTTIYRYREPVSFGEHRVMFRPRDSHDQRVIATALEVSPQSIVRMIQDPHSNSIALVQPLESATELKIVCSFTIEHAQNDAFLTPLAKAAEFVPFAYSPDERLDLEHYLRPHHIDPQGKLIVWTHQFLAGGGTTGTRELLAHMNRHIGQTLLYTPRDEEGTQTPLETLALGSGSCRDYALLMMEALRRLGIAARFVSGYLYDASLDAGGDAMSAAGPLPRRSHRSAQHEGTPVTGAGVTHAWLQAYLPGAGWVTYDPTNNLTGGSQLIRVAVVRDPAFAAPVSGSWFGEPNAYLGMSATVQVRRRDVDHNTAAGLV